MPATSQKRIWAWEPPNLDIPAEGHVPATPGALGKSVLAVDNGGAPSYIALV